MGGVDAELISRVSASTGLSPGEAARVVTDIIGWYQEPVEVYVRRQRRPRRDHERWGRGDDDWDRRDGRGEWRGPDGDWDRNYVD